MKMTFPDTGEPDEKGNYIPIRCGNRVVTKSGAEYVVTPSGAWRKVKKESKKG
jgi:hypothetical protein